MDMQTEQPHAAPDRLKDGYSAFTSIYQQHAPHIFAFFYRQVGHRQDAEDLTATTFSKALGSIEHYTEQGSFEAWLWSIARHTLRDAQRRQRETIDIEQVDFQLIDPAPTTETQVLQTEQLEMVLQLVHSLPADQRQAVLLRFFGEWSFHDIARSLGRSIGAVKMLVQRALATLRMHHTHFEHLQFEGTIDTVRSSVDPHTTGAAFQLQRVIAVWMSFIAQWWHIPHLQPVLILQPVPIPCDNPVVYAVRRRR